MKTVSVRQLGLAAYMKMKNCTLLKVEGGNFIFNTDRDLNDWRVEYMNSCCHRHDTELINLRSLLKNG